MENPENQLRDLATKKLIEIINVAFKVKKTEDHSFIEDIQTDSIL